MPCCCCCSSSSSSSSSVYVYIDTFHALINVLCIIQNAGISHARMEGVNKPELLPSGPVTPVIDVAGFLTEGEEARIKTRVENLEKDTGVKLRVLAQNYPDTPGLAIKDYWGVDDDTVVFVYVCYHEK